MDSALSSPLLKCETKSQNLPTPVFMNSRDCLALVTGFSSYVRSVYYYESMQTDSVIRWSWPLNTLNWCFLSFPKLFFKSKIFWGWIKKWVCLVREQEVCSSPEPKERSPCLTASEWLLTTATKWHSQQRCDTWAIVTETRGKFQQWHICKIDCAHISHSFNINDLTIPWLERKVEHNLTWYMFHVMFSYVIFVLCFLFNPFLLPPLDPLGSSKWRQAFWSCDHCDWLA